MNAATEAAEAVAESVRALNHAALPPGAYEWPSDVYAVVGHLGTAVARMVQALEQAGHWLEQTHAAGLVRDDRCCWDVDETVSEVLGGLEGVAREARHLAVSLDMTHECAAHLAGVPDEGPEARS